MKKLLFIFCTSLLLSACHQSKNVYFNGAEGSNSGVKYESRNQQFSWN